ncbi:MAG: amidase [Gammaproteobacteria bacterium]|nr:amidase [Gammaproteobacteria bacterium]MDH5513022.1 amidase [Gammaproteobacteria bacterium]
MGDTLHLLGVKEALHGLSEKRFTGEDLVRDCLLQVAKLDPKIEAWAWLKSEAALERARVADADRKAGKHGALQGIPVGVKDIIDVQGVPTRMGSSAFEDYLPTLSARAVRCLDEAGAVMLGKTVTAELAFYAPGKTRNPWNLAHTPGGSSSGSAAAVAARFVPAAIGTQTNGSVIRPAAFCGVVGYKPSAGLISRAGVLRFSHTLDQVGVFARSVPDAAVVAGALMGYAQDDPDSLSDFSVVPQDLDPQPLFQPPRLAAVRTPAWQLADSDQQENFTQCIAVLRKAGAAIETAMLPDDFGRAHDVHRTIMHYEGARAFAHLQEQHRDRLSAEMNRLIDEGLLISETAYHGALENRTRLRGELGEFMNRFDSVLTLPARGEAPATLANTGDPLFCTIWTLCGAPAISLPTGLGAHGMPLGLQLVGGYQQDARLLQVAQWCSLQIGFRQGPPGI